jgi:hypothetical protein
MDSDYPFEALGPDKFQRLAQVMISTEFPDTQAFPLRQPDGGRDSVVYRWDGDRRSFSVFQVKFVERPDSLDDPHKWVLETAEAEAKKVAQLIPKGAESYTLVTNIRGTGHADSGSIDRLDSTLTKALGIPARGWWRDDLITRVKANSQFRWEFPDLLSGVDVLQELVESDLSEEKNRRSTAVKAYLTQQFEEDQQVRFKQVDLQKDLLGLFVDIPISISSNRKSRQDSQLFEALWLRLHGEGENLESNHLAEQFHQADRSRRLDFPASYLLLDSEFQEQLPLVVVEGAPGQGKSTITQYLCQVHRMRLLERETSRLPDAHAGVPLRLPFRIDLRDLATWFQGRDPFTPDQDLAADEPRSVEAFIAASISHHSGGVDFDVADLLAVLKATAAVAVFDGLDEVADIETRKKIVDELTTTARRIAANSLSFQMIVTSRPAAFAKSPGFDPKIFRHLTLEAITPDIAAAYSDKWIKARQLTSRDAREVKQVLETKLEESHMRELARNTMQLTILLSLIYARGSSLPDKRTALYGAYIDTFLNRESEKSAIVREHRDLLVSLHGYLAWTLHSDAEQGSGSGRISRDDLTQLLEEYLDTEGHDASLVDKLFEGVVTRVVAVVSRVEGLYEFEVQPLREYFAARFLYDTARYSPTGGEVGGTLPDRFLALARNPYWLNVARFYAGFLSKGEIPSLVESLKDLSEDTEFSPLRQPRVLASMLLADWVFSQNPRSLDDVVELVADPLNVQVSMGNTPFRVRDAVEALPDGSGRKELADLCFTQLEGMTNLAFGSSLANVISQNCATQERKERWLRNVDGLSGAERRRWITYGRFLGVIEVMSDAELDALLEHPPALDELMEVLACGRGEYIESDEYRCESVVDTILSGRWPYMISTDDSSVLNHLGIVYAYTQHNLFGVRGLDRPGHRASPRSHAHSQELLDKCDEVARVWQEENRSEGYDWGDSLRPWDSLIEKSRELFGERCMHSILAVEASGIKSTEETAREAGDLFDQNLPLAQRARYARLRAGNPRWWEAQLNRAAAGDERFLAIALIFSRASGRTIGEHVEQLDAFLKRMSADEFRLLSYACSRALPSFRGRGAGTLGDRDFDLPKQLSDRTVEILAKRASGGMGRRLYERYLRSYTGKSTSLLDICIENELAGQQRNQKAWLRVLPLLRRHQSRHFMHRARFNDMPVSVARDICSDAASFDAELVYWAETRCVGATRFQAVSKVAMQQRWFEGS